MFNKFVHSGRAGLSHSKPSDASVLQRLILARIVSGLSKRLMRLPSFSALLLILLVPSKRDITRAPSVTIKAAGSRNTWPKSGRQDPKEKERGRERQRKRTRGGRGFRREVHAIERRG